MKVKLVVKKMQEIDLKKSSKKIKYNFTKGPTKTETYLVFATKFTMTKNSQSSKTITAMNDLVFHELLKVLKYCREVVLISLKLY